MSAAAKVESSLMGFTRGRASGKTVLHLLEGTPNNKDFLAVLDFRPRKSWSLVESTFIFERNSGAICNMIPKC